MNAAMSPTAPKPTAMNTMLMTAAFASRNGKEIRRDRINLAFGLGFPIVLLLLLTAIQANVPVELFPIPRLTPGIAVFGLSFIAVFAGMVIARDRSSSFMLRLFTSPLPASGFILGYTVPLLPMAIGQMAVCFVVASFLGLAVNAGVLLAVLVLIPVAVLFIAIGLLCGSLLNERQVGGLCGALLINLSAWLSDTWFDLDLVGGAFRAVAYVLPFVHAVEAGRAALAGDYGAILPHLWWVIGYTVVVFVLAVAVFTRQMRAD